jgi:aminoglycoside phosphotransferase (APT) family kinase protein
MTSRSSARIAEVIARSAGRLSKVELVRSGMNDVYAVDDLVIRLPPPGVDIERQTHAARLLARQGVATPTLVDSGVVDDQPFTVWERVQADPVGSIDFRQLGSEINRLHRIDPAALTGEITLPWCDEESWLDLDASLDAAEAANLVPLADIDILRGWWEQLRSWGDRCRAAGNPVVCHGDVHPQNVIMRHGEPIVIDWDTICLGPPQWDHAALLTWSDRWGGEPSAYPNFTAGYGASFASDQLANDLADSQQLAAEAQLRIKYWRGEAAAPAWTPQ